MRLLSTQDLGAELRAQRRAAGLTQAALKQGLLIVDSGSDFDNPELLAKTIEHLNNL